MQVQLPLIAAYKHRTYDALATSVPLSDYDEEEMEVGDVGKSTQPDNHLKESLFALVCFCPVGVKALGQSLIVSIISQLLLSESEIQLYVLALPKSGSTSTWQKSVVLTAHWQLN